jgi:hypothetical protein
MSNVVLTLRVRNAPHAEGVPHAEREDYDGKTTGPLETRRPVLFAFQAARPPATPHLIFRAVFSSAMAFWSSPAA